MTPQLMQAIKLLQMSNLELEAAVREEVDQNPFLTLSPRGDGRVAPKRDVSSNSAPLDPFAAVAVRETLADHCRREIAGLKLDDTGRYIAEFLIGSLEPEGRLAPDAVADAITELGVSRAEVEATLEAVQGIDPAGLFSRDLGECLALQLKAAGDFDEIAERVIANLQLVAKRDVRRLADVCGTSEAQVIEVLARLRALDPRPGLAFDATPLVAIEPDVIVRKRPEGGFLVSLDTQRLPKVLVDADYHAEVTSMGNPAAVSFANQSCARPTG